MLTTEEEAEQHRIVTRAVHAEGGKIAMQILHFGRYAYHPDMVAPSALKSPITPFTPHALTGDERTRAEALLADASDLIRTTCPRWHTAKPATLKRIACMAVKRAMQAGPDMSGVTQSTQTAGSYSESLSYANPAGDLYLTTSEKEALGGDGEAWAYDMAGGAA